MTEYLTISGADKISITSTQEALAQRDHLLAQAALITQIDSNAGALAASEILKQVKAFTRLIESSRTDVKAPLLEKGRQIDSLAKEITLELEAQATQISGLIGSWTAEQARQVKLAMEKAQKEATALIEKKRLEDEPQAAKVKAEADALAAQAAAASPDDAVAIQMQADWNAEQAKRAQATRDAAAQQQVAALAAQAKAVAGPRAAGIATKTVTKWEVTSLDELMAHSRFLVVITPNVSALNAAVKTLQPGQVIPGLRTWNESSVIVRG